MPAERGARRALLGLAGALLVAALGACGGPPAAAPPAATATAVLPDGGCERRVTITNRAPLTLTEFFYRPAGTTEWGLDRFGTRQLATNQSISFRISGAGMHDLRAVWSNNREARLDGVNFCETGLIVADERGLARR